MQKFRYVNRGLTFYGGFFVLVVAFVLTGCTVATTPVRVSESRYTFFIEYGQGVDLTDINTKAEETVQKIKEENGHQRCGFSRDNTNNRDMKHAFIVICDEDN